MNIKLFVSTLSLLSLSYANVYKFNVVSLSGSNNIIGVKYNNQLTQLSTSAFPLFTGVVNADKIDNYKYVVMEKDGKVIEEESINRVYSESNSIINEVYNRTTKTVDVIDLPKVFNSEYKNNSEKYPDFPLNEIFNIYAKCDNTYDTLKNQPFLEDKKRNDVPTNCTFNIITPNEHYLTTGSAHIIGYGSRLYKKVSWGLKFDSKIMGRKAVKIRALANDPTLMREKISADLYNSVGVPVQRGVYARVMINDDVWGLYYLIDSLNKRWLSSYFHGGEKSKVGTNYILVSTHPTGPYADLKYIGDDSLSYIEKGTYGLDEDDTDDLEAIKNNQNGYYRLINFTKMFNDWILKYGQNKSEEAIPELEKFLDLESTLKLLAIETLTLARDNFWLVMSNTALYYNKEINKYVFIPFDFDELMKGSKSDYFPDNYMDECIKWAGEVSGLERHFIDNILSFPKILERYNIILAKTLRDAFNVKAFTPYIESVANLIREDVQWNFDLLDKLPTTYDGYTNHYTLQNFEDNLKNGKVEYFKGVIADNNPYGILEYVGIREGKCKAYTKDVKIPIEDEITTSNAISLKISITLIISQIILLLFF
ncbi:hypothetical protein BCR32DRAFT_264237 [Anaeromyces robustus]|jgi:hypothetical protein|uniref:Coth-domain-containing protein n=1 Tax=Anaeromyces robustus TaxID=1754192 RepID=A0A1Y1XP17_9FUNG|nr:hypothetical protein BCR32DRAFT_264237 [Anaeromyces robustus]|eukprot:ORX87472.1 hypothetical protein BCR32DRAFT_264237 [Anaeromyces robustus]